MFYIPIVRSPAASVRNLTRSRLNVQLVIPSRHYIYAQARVYKRSRAYIIRYLNYYNDKHAS